MRHAAGRTQIINNQSSIENIKGFYMPEQNASQICIVTVTGRDRVGIIAKLATAMAKANINIVDVNQKIMEDYFVMTMAADIGQATLDMGQIKNSSTTSAGRCRSRSPSRTKASSRQCTECEKFEV